MKKILLSLSVIIALSACEEFVTQEPVDLVLTEDAIIDAASADQALLGVYSRMQVDNLWGHNVIGSHGGLLSDELEHSGSFPSFAEMDANDVTSGNVSADDVWRDAYIGVFQSNNVLEILGSEAEISGLTDAQRTIHIGEARFARALFHFTVAAFYGNVPLVETTDVSINSAIGQTGQSAIYTWVVGEAATAATELAGADWGTNQQYRATEWAALALQARALLYSGDASGAAAIADNIITNGPFSLEADYADLFQPSAVSDEFIFTLFNSVQDQNELPFQFLPDGRFEYAVGAPFFAAHGSDPRALIDLHPSDAQGRYFVNKYADLANGADNSPVFRLAEMYLIRAEGNANSASAVADINTLRTRAGAAAYTGSGSLDDILNERFIELSFEGHRFLDLVRTGRAEAVIGAVSNFSATDGILPIPERDILLNSALVQNPGY